MVGGLGERRGQARQEGQSLLGEGRSVTDGAVPLRIRPPHACLRAVPGAVAGPPCSGSLHALDPWPLPAVVLLFLYGVEDALGL
ncbi:hypothetical protein SY2F82_12870 [Streptomyces sp. Y2F8-2]|nr:hypothetical protein SY2F82_12870 [Streptomyces sp. Y2F8-2]